MREHIHAGSSRDAGRQTMGEFRIEQANARSAVHAANRYLDGGLGVESTDRIVSSLPVRDVVGMAMTGAPAWGTLPMPT